MSHSSKGSEAFTSGVRITTRPAFSAQESSPDRALYVFSYRIRIANESARAVQLLERYWQIVDADGESHEVRGERVVGRTPIIPPGGVFEYTSRCPLRTVWGTMEGFYLMREVPQGSEEEPQLGERFRAAVARFYLVASADDLALCVQQEEAL